MKKSLRDIGREIHEEVIVKTETAALRKSKTDIVIIKIYRKDLEDYLSRGWEIISHTPSSYVTMNSYLVQINAEELRGRLENAASV